jgi:hypothetical protein
VRHNKTVNARWALIELAPWTPCRSDDFLIDSSISSILAAGLGHNAVASVEMAIE